MTREERIEAALATAGKTSEEPWRPDDYQGNILNQDDEIVASDVSDGNAPLFIASPDLRDEVIALRAQVGDMAAIVRKLVHRLGPENTTSKQALDYLFRKGLQGSPARDTALAQIESEEDKL